MLRFAAPPIPHVRIGLIGLGRRGLRTIERYAFVEGASIVAIADLTAEAIEEAQGLFRSSNRPVPQAFSGAEAAEALMHLEEVDLVMICTDWFTHAALAITAMEAGKHVAVEVPAAVTIEECHALVATAERTERHCFMMENCCYDPFALGTYGMHRAGLLGEIKQCEGAYAHDLYSEYARTGQGEGVYRWLESPYPFAHGNAYATHGLGPIALLLDLHRTDRITSVYSVASGQTSLAERNVTTLLRTAQGRTITLELDLHTPRPYSRRQTVNATEAYVSKYPVPQVQLRHDIQADTDQPAMIRVCQHMPKALRRIYEEGLAKNVPNVMNYLMDTRLIYCLHHGLPLDIDIYDAAEWSSIAALSAESERTGLPVDFIDFTAHCTEERSTHTFHARRTIAYTIDDIE